MGCLPGPNSHAANAHRFRAPPRAKAFLHERIQNLPKAVASIVRTQKPTKRRVIVLVVLEVHLGPHKYTYVHGDPIQGVDPSGKFIGVATIVGFAIGQAVHGKLQSSKAYKDLGRMGDALRSVRAILWGVTSGIATALAFGGVMSTTAKWFGIPTPMSSRGFRRPARDQNSRVVIWELNIETLLNQSVDSHPSASPDQKAAAKTVTRDIVRVYVEAVRQKNAADFSPADKGTPGGWFGWGSGPHGWEGNSEYGPHCNCASWTEYIVGQIRNKVNLAGTYWQFRAHWDTNKYGESVLAMLSTHSFSSLSFEPSGPELPATQTGGNQFPWWTHYNWKPDVILDPWMFGRPDLFDPSDHGSDWPIETGKYENF